MTINNIISLAFKTVSTVSDAVELLENFDTLAKRPLVKEFVHRKAADMVFKLFLNEIHEVEMLYEAHTSSKKTIPMPFSHPKWGGLAIWAYSLIKRLEKSREAVRHLYFAADSPVQREALDKYKKQIDALDQYISSHCKTQWLDSITALTQDAIENKLNNSNILVRSENSQNELPSQMNSALFNRSKKSGLLESNFDSELHKLIGEGTYWQKIMSLGLATVPPQVSKLLTRKEQLRILRENVMLIVRDYNNIKHTIEDKEVPLFQEHLGRLDAQILPGIRKYTWVSSADAFVNHCRAECKKVFEEVKSFQGNVQKIYTEFDKITRTILTNVEKTLYLLPNFIRTQDAVMK